MYKTLIAALLFGILPVSISSNSADSPSLAGIDIAPPSERLQFSERLSASGAIVIDLSSGQEVFGIREDGKYPMASLTKIMTALIIAENHKLDERVRVPRDAANIEGNSSYLPVGEEFKVGDLLSALLIASANDAAYTLSVYHSGSEEAFADEMNLRARALGLSGTQFANSMGLDSPDQWSTARDLAWLASFAFRREDIRKLMGTKYKRIYSLSGQPVDLTNTNALLHTDTSVFAGKTGTTSGAKQCLISFVRYGGKEYVVVLLHSDRRYTDMEKILSVLKSMNGKIGANNMSNGSKSGGSGETIVEMSATGSKLF